MPTIIQISKHSPEDCAMFNEKARKMTLDILAKLEGLAKKHGVKVIGAWNVPSEHLVIAVYEAPTFEAFQKFTMEPEIIASSAYTTTEIKAAITSEELVKMLKQAK
jgi:uncharacterized protein with GYD domain